MLINWYSNIFNIVNSQPFPIHLNKEVTPEIIKLHNPNAIIIATGSKPIIPNIKGIKNAVSADKVFNEELS